ncbi:hypothetical protein T07_13137 [Trichinella nelsoni]|uniref:Uncharacterized protein n=1 Tax=Trichinella nelsoni TaxID=6336 RepID=A0A0V0RIY3_9BILA|nr:hypothetical protein T07_13137 [Trichinella nelsoni]
MTLGLCAPAGHDRTAAVHWKASDLRAGVSRKKLCCISETKTTAGHGWVEQLLQAGSIWSNVFCQRGWEKSLPSVKMATLYD